MEWHCLFFKRFSVLAAFPCQKYCVRNVIYCNSIVFMALMTIPSNFGNIKVNLSITNLKSLINSSSVSEEIVVFVSGGSKC